MKFKLPAFLENIESPVEGEVALRKFAANPLAFGGDLDLFSAGANVASSGSAVENSVIVVGIDEVGRGPLAGPVVACAAVLKSPDALLTLNDSKKLSRPKREAMFDAVKDACACYAIASASVEEIDEINILEADFLAMRRALQALGFPGLNETVPEIPIEVKGSFNVVMPDSLSEMKDPVTVSLTSSLLLMAISKSIRCRKTSRCPSSKAMAALQVSRLRQSSRKYSVTAIWIN